MEKTMKYAYLMLLLFILWNICDADDNSTFDCEIQQQTFSKVILTLCSKLMNEIDGDDNFFFSPLSLSIALAMIYVGARHTTREQMSDTLNYKDGEDSFSNLRISRGFRDLIRALETENDNSLSIANSIFIHRDYTVSSHYISKLKHFFRANIDFLDFTNERIVSMEKINDWVFNYTNGKISNLLVEPLNPMTIMILINAVYFKGLWNHPFSESLTWNSLFYRKNGTSKTVPFMILQENLNFYYDEKLGYSFLELDYVGGQMSMILILPKNVQDFPKLDLTPEILCNIKSQLEPTDVMLVLPKFRMEYKRELSKDMKNLGMENLFSDRADLSGIREENDLHVSLMVHKAVIVVDEHGSEASAVSGVGIDGRKKNSEQMMFWADHTFLFHILDKRTNTVLFSGRVADP